MKPERIQPPKIYYRGTATVEIELDGEHHFLGGENRLLDVGLGRGSQLANGETLVLLVDPRDKKCFGNAAPDLVALETCSPAGSADVYIVLSAATAASHDELDDFELPTIPPPASSTPPSSPPLPPPSPEKRPDAGDPDSQARNKP